MALSPSSLPRSRGAQWLPFLGLIFLLGNPQPTLGQAPAIPEAQIILFTPSDVEPPAPSAYLPNLHRFGEYAEQFFHDELKRWGHAPKRKEIFNRDEKGKISVLHLKGDLKAAGGEYQKEWLSRQVQAKLKSEPQIQFAGNLFWIFVYVGDPPARHANFRGAGDSKNGGWAVLNYTNLPGRVELDQPMVSPFHHEVVLKGCIHEFGHALGLPHIGPKVELGRGNTLMGPITRFYRGQNQPDDSLAYLSEASAAILSAHPAFTGDPSFRNKLPQTVFKELRVTQAPGGDAISLSGKLETNHPVHRLVVIDDREDKPGAYWVKGYVTKLTEASEFSLSIPRPKSCRGQLKLLVVYQNGAVTGGSLKRGIGSATSVPYAFP